MLNTFHVKVTLGCFNMCNEAGRNILNINRYGYILRPAIHLFPFMESDIFCFKGSTFSNFLRQFTFLAFRIYKIWTIRVAWKFLNIIMDVWRQVRLFRKRLTDKSPINIYHVEYFDYKCTAYWIWLTRRADEMIISSRIELRTIPHSESPWLHIHQQYPTLHNKYFVVLYSFFPSSFPMYIWSLLPSVV